MSLPDNILKIRKKLKMSQEQFARHVGLSDGYVSQLESGERSARLATLTKLAGKLKIKTADLLK